nr:hypothetical protein [Variovorax boronicumulans]
MTMYGPEMTLKLIEGGAAGTRIEPRGAAGTSHLPGQVEAERLRVAVMSLNVPGTNLSVAQALEAILAFETDPLANPEDHSLLCAALEDLGIRYTPEHEVTQHSPSMFALVFPQRLLKAHPELAGLHPIAHPMLRLEAGPKQRDHA